MALVGVMLTFAAPAFQPAAWVDENSGTEQSTKAKQVVIRRLDIANPLMWQCFSGRRCSLRRHCNTDAARHETLPLACDAPIIWLELLGTLARTVITQ